MAPTSQKSYDNVSEQRYNIIRFIYMATCDGILINSLDAGIVIDAGIVYRNLFSGFPFCIIMLLQKKTGILNIRRHRPEKVIEKIMTSRREINNHIF